MKHKQRVKYEAEPWWEGLRGGEKTRPQATADKAAEQGYVLLERLWQREFDFAPRVVHLRSEHLR